MGGVQVAVAPHRVREPPAALVIGAAQLQLAQVVQVPALRVQQLAEDALPHHVEDHHLFTVVAAVLHHHAVAARLLGRVHQLPALVDRRRHRHLGGGVLPLAHRLDAHRRVQLPGRDDEDEVEIAVAQPLPLLRPAGVRHRAPARPPSHMRRGPRSTLAGTRSQIARTSAPGTLRKFDRCDEPWWPRPMIPTPHAIDRRRGQELRPARLWRRPSGWPRLRRLRRRRLHLGRRRAWSSGTGGDRSYLT